MTDNKKPAPKKAAGSKPNTAAKKSTKAPSKVTKPKASQKQSSKPPKPKSEKAAEEEKPLKAVPASDEIPDNVTKLRAETQVETPLIMQPQVWITAAVAAFALFFIFLKKKKRR